MEQKKAQHEVVIFTTPTCPWCSTVKSYLREKYIRLWEVKSKEFLIVQRSDILAVVKNL